MYFILKDRKVIENCVEEILKSKGMAVRIDKPKRSSLQNSLYWALLKVLSDYTGFTSEDLHDRLRVQFLGVERKTVKGVELIMPVSTRILNTKQFTEYIDKIYMLGDNLSLKLPRPPHFGYEDENDTP